MVCSAKETCCLRDKAVCYKPSSRLLFWDFQPCQDVLSLLEDVVWDCIFWALHPLTSWKRCSTDSSQGHMCNNKLFENTVLLQQEETHLLSNINCSSQRFSGTRMSWTLRGLVRIHFHSLLPHTYANCLSIYREGEAEPRVIFQNYRRSKEPFCFNKFTDLVGHDKKFCSNKVNWSAGRFCTNLSSDAFLNLNEPNSLIYSYCLVQTPFLFCVVFICTPICNEMNFSLVLGTTEIVIFSFRFCSANTTWWRS